MENLNEKYKSEIEKAYEEIRGIFNFDIEYKINFYNAREDFEKAIGKNKTPAWNTGNTNSSKRTISIVSPLIWEKEGAHKIDELPGLLKHEITHLFTHEISKDKMLPMWLTEGVAGYLSGQYKRKKGFFIEKDFCRKLDTYHNWNQLAGFDQAYSVANKFTSFLCERYSFDKIKKLIENAPVNYEYDKFNLIFKNIFLKDILEIESEFINSLD